MTSPTAVEQEPSPPSLYHLLDPEVLADPYPLYRRLRDEDPVHWDPYLHAWVVTRYADVVEVLHRFRAARTPDPDRLVELGLGELTPIAAVMVRQMLFLDPPEHGRVRRLASVAFTPRRVAVLREHIRQIAETLVDDLVGEAAFDVMAGLANPLPAIVTAEMLGVPTSDHELLKSWSQDFAEMLGNFQHNPGRAKKMLRSVEEMVTYFHEAVIREAVAADRGPDQRSGHRRGRRRPAERGRGHRQRHRDHGRWPGDHHQPDRQRPAHPVAPARPARATPVRPDPDAERRRGAAALRESQPAHRPPGTGRGGPGRQGRSPKATP